MKRLIYLDSCKPDYFQGFGGETYIAFHWKGQTIAEMIESLVQNAQNEMRDTDWTAIDNFKSQWLNSPDKGKLAINEQHCEPDENGDSGLVHYFGMIETEE